MLEFGKCCVLLWVVCCLYPLMVPALCSWAVFAPSLLCSSDSLSPCCHAASCLLAFFGLEGPSHPMSPLLCLSVTVSLKEYPGIDHSFLPPGLSQPLYPGFVPEASG